MMDTNGIAAAINKNAMTEAEAISPVLMELTVRPQGSSRTFSVLVRVEHIREV